MSNIFKLTARKTFSCLLAVALLSACHNEEIPSGDILLKEGEVALQWLPANLGKMTVSRGTDNKNNEEQKITNVHIFLFDQDGLYLEAKDADAFQGYRRLDNANTNLVLQTSMFADETKAKQATIFVLANMPENTFVDRNNDGKPDNVTKLSDLQTMSIKLPTFTTNIPEAGLPMTLQLDGQDLSNDATEKIIILQLKSLMARVDLNFTMNPLQATPGADYPALEFQEVTIGNFPDGGTAIPQLDNPATTETTDNGKTIQLVTQTIVNSPLVGRLLREGNSVNTTFYMFEHARLAQDFSYPTMEEGDEYARQRYKNKRAADDAAYIEFVGRYSSHNDFNYRVTYRLYIGANPEDDFTIKSNCQYKNNITVTGISANNYGEEALLDTRVTIDKATPVFIEILRERMHDAHFNVTPMDIYLNNDEVTEVTFTLLNENGEPANANEMTWIRMEPYYYAPTEKCDYKEGEYAAQKAGDGKRKYFTTNLLTELNKNEYNRSYTVTQPEERIYLYIDENIPGDDLPEQIPSRQAKIRVTYKLSSGTTSSREFLIEQAGMRKITFNKYSTGGEYYTARRQAYDFYIEEYEEYLSHYDGKNPYTATYEGLEWGVNDVVTGLGVGYGQQFYQFMSWGWYNTTEIMDAYRSHSSWRGHEVTLNEKTNGAAEYCYNKNKRNEDGSITNVEWFLPTISELEFALDKYYGTYEVFQNKWYWSSNPGAIGEYDPSAGENTGNFGEDETRGRATKAVYNNGKFEHAVSAANEKYENGKGGSANRTQIFRIRAAYIPQNKKPTDAYQ